MTIITKTENDQRTKVELYQDGKATGKTATLNESNNWTHTWAGLDEKAKGQQVKYTVEELTKVKGYTTHVDNNDMGKLIVTNKYTPETTSISGEKVWTTKIIKMVRDQKKSV